jgi:sec-independent protein translocase protein TatA
MFGLGIPELIIIMGIIFFLFGAKKLPEVASGLGKSITSFRKAIKEPEADKESDGQEDKQQS